MRAKRGLRHATHVKSICFQTQIGPEVHREPNDLRSLRLKIGRAAEAISRGVPWSALDDELADVRGVVVGVLPAYR